MKKLLLVGVLLLAGVTQAADRYKKIECQFSESNYGLSAAKLSIEKEWITSARMNKEDELEINHSVSECEDSTTIIIEQESVTAYKSGKAFEAQVKHESPDVKIEGYAICQQKK